MDRTETEGAEQVNRFMDTDTWPINRLESIVIQLLWKALQHPHDEQVARDLHEACDALQHRAKTEHTPVEVTQANLRRKILVGYARDMHRIMREQQEKK